jgi:threonine synthase
MSLLSHLVCSSCGQEFEAQKVQTFCLSCNAPLLAQYDLTAAKQTLDREEITHNKHLGMWRWHEMLPVLHPDNMLYLGEGDTPLIKTARLGQELGLHHLYVKDESLNPTGTFKARGLSAAISKAKELGVSKVIIPTAGNAGGAMAAYAARGNMQALIIMPKDTPLANIEESRIYGAEVVLVEGLISDAAKLVKERMKEGSWFDISTFKEPYRCEGKKIMGYELAESFNWELPEVIIYPTGGGTGLVGMWKAFAEMKALGWLKSNNFPKMVAVQADGCAPVVKAFVNGKETCEFWENAQTKASGLRVPRSFADRIILQDIRASQGTCVAVSDDEIDLSQRRLASSEGIFAAPEGAATLAALENLVRENWVHPDERIVLFNTGTGLKYLA